MKRKENKENEPPLARWKDIAQPASLSTKTGKRRFLVTIKLPERSLKTASDFVAEMNAALKTTEKVPASVTHFVLVDSERTRLQRATAEFSTFKAAQTCLLALKEFGLLANDVSGELEDFGKKKYDPWFEHISKAWWPWLAAWRDPAPEMPMMKPTNRLDVSAGSKYKQRGDGKLGKSDEEDREVSAEDHDKDDNNERPRDDEDRPEKKKRRKKKRSDEGEPAPD